MVEEGEDFDIDSLMASLEDVGGTDPELLVLGDEQLNETGEGEEGETNEIEVEHDRDEKTGTENEDGMEMETEDAMEKEPSISPDDDLTEVFNARESPDAEQSLLSTEEFAVDAMITPTLKKVIKKKIPAPSWASSVNCPSIDEVMRDLLINKSLNMANVKFLSLLCTGDSVRPMSLKVVVLPLPGKFSTLRIVDSEGNKENALENTAVCGGLQRKEYSFGEKSISLNMSAGDVRSKIFRDGAYPSISISVTFSTGGTASWEGLFPTFCTLVGPVSLDLCSTDIPNLSCTLILEVLNPKRVDALSENVVITRRQNFNLEVLGILDSWLGVTDINIVSSVKSSGRKNSTKVKASPFGVSSGTKFKGGKIRLPSVIVNLDILEISVDFLDDSSQHTVQVPMHVFSGVSKTSDPIVLKCSAGKDNNKTLSLVCRLYPSGGELLTPSSSSSQLKPFESIDLEEESKDEFLLYKNNIPYADKKNKKASLENVSEVHSASLPSIVLGNSIYIDSGRRKQMQPRKGYLNVLLYGIVAPNNTDCKSKIMVEATMFPAPYSEGRRRKKEDFWVASDNIQMSQRPANQPGIQGLIMKDVSFYLVSNPTDPTVSYMKFVVSQKINESDKKRQNLGAVILDLCSVLVNRDPSVHSLAITNSTLGPLVILVGLHFVPQPDIPSTLSGGGNGRELLTICDREWTDGYSKESSGNPNSFLHTVVESVQIPQSFDSLKLTASCYTGFTSEFIGSFSTTLKANDTSGWSDSLFIPSCSYQLQFNLVMYVGEQEIFVGSALIAVPRSRNLEKGMPLVIDLPLRDSCARKIALLSLSMHESSMWPRETLKSPIANDERLNQSTYSTLSVKVTGGDLALPTNMRLEPMFECSLLCPSNWNQQLLPPTTSSHCVSDPLKTQWNAECKFPLLYDNTPLLDRLVPSEKWFVKVTCKV